MAANQVRAYDMQSINEGLVVENSIWIGATGYGTAISVYEEVKALHRTQSELGQQLQQIGIVLRSRQVKKDTACKRAFFVVTEQVEIQWKLVTADKASTEQDTPGQT